jgi:hypothetical protein
MSMTYDLGHGLLATMGPNVHPQAGARMLLLSSGTARQPTDPGYSAPSGFDKGYTCNAPTGFPKESPACPGIVTGQPHDGVALEVTLRVPSNVLGFSFNSNFYTFEWPDYVCSTYNDFALALLSPIPMGQTDGNIMFDALGNPVSVNAAFLQACGCASGPPCTAGGRAFTCALGDAALIGTGFGKDTAMEDHGSSYWLETKAPVTPNSTITIRFTVYDSGDGILDSSVLFDNWTWLPQSTVVGTMPH